MHKRKRNLYFLIPILWTVAITVLSLITLSADVGSSIKIPNKDKYVHFTFYFGFVVLWFLFAKIKENRNKRKIIVVCSAIGYGILMEIFQGIFTTTRTPDLLDVVANSLGALTGILVITLFKKK